MLVFLLSGWMSARWAADPAGEQIEALFGQFRLGGAGYLAIIANCRLHGAVDRNDFKERCVPPAPQGGMKRPH